MVQWCLEFVSLGVFEAIDKGEDVSVKFYKDWVENVKNYVPNDRLLVFDVKEGWDPLCKFLDVPVPNAPFPWENDAAKLRGMYDKVKWVSYLFFVGLPILTAFGTSFYFKYGK